MGPIRVMLVDDHHVVRMGLASVLRMYPKFSVVGEAATAEEAVIVARECRPDVVLMDVRLPDGDGIQASVRIRKEQPRVRILMLTSYSDQEALHAAVMAGATGYLLKRCEPERLVEAVERVAQGASVLDPEVTGTLLGLVRGGDREVTPFDRLTDQERRLLPLIAAGKTNREIAVELGISWYTVKAHVSRALQKLDLHRRVELARLASGSEAGE